MKGKTNGNFGTEKLQIFWTEGMNLGADNFRKGIIGL